ncbi:MAG TPA: hypothetical protein VF343_08080 [Syntrophales bacterium]
MEKEEKQQSSQSADQEDTLSHSEFGFVYDFFISEKSDATEKMTAREQTQEKKEDDLKFGDPSVIFFLPDFFTDET